MLLKLLAVPPVLVSDRGEYPVELSDLGYDRFAEIALYPKRSFGQTYDTWWRRTKEASGIPDTTKVALKDLAIDAVRFKSQADKLYATPDHVLASDADSENLRTYREEARAALDIWQPAAAGNLWHNSGSPFVKSAAAVIWKWALACVSSGVDIELVRSGVYNWLTLPERKVDFEVAKPIWRAAMLVQLASDERGGIEDQVSLLAPTPHPSPAALSELVGEATDVWRSIRRHQISGPSLRDLIAEYLPPNVDMKRLFESELAQAASEGAEPFWKASKSSTAWLENVFAFWHKSHGTPADRVRIVVDRSRPVRPSGYSGIPHDAERGSTPGKVRLTLDGLRDFEGDKDHALFGRPTRWGLVHWVEFNHPVFRSANPQASVFGINGWVAVPHLLCVHCVVQTGDGYVLLCLRHPEKDYSPLTWSASFEEQVEVSESDEAQRDRFVVDTVATGLHEEFGIGDKPADVHHCLSQASVLLIGRECFDRVLQSDEVQAVRSSAVFASVALDLSLRSMFGSVADSGRARDKEEHCAWVGIRPRSQEQLLALLGKAGAPESRCLREVLDDLQMEHVFHEDSERIEVPFQWHPTSRARLLLWADWARVTGRL